MKRFMGIVLLLVLQLGTAVGWLAYGTGKSADAEEEWRQIAVLSPEERRMQENLAMWYNLNLTNAGEGTAAEGYGQILFLEDGCMCGIEFPQGGKKLPVWHGEREKRECGLTHLSGSALPVGGKGNHAVLTGGKNVVEGMDVPERSDLFYVHILGDTLIYRIFDVKTTKRDPALPESADDRDLCSIWIRVDTEWLIIRGVRVEQQTGARENIG